MKRNIIGGSLAVLAILPWNVLGAQEQQPLRQGEVGIRVMPMFTSLDVNTYGGNVVEGTATLGMGYGAMVAYNFSKNVGIQGEINYNGISQNYKDQNLERRVTLNYVDFPVLLTLNTDKTVPVNFGLHVGPQFGVNVGAEVDGETSGDTDTLHGVLAVKEGDVGLAYGAGVEFALDKEHHVRLDLGFRGMYGLVDMSAKTTGPNTYNILVSGSRKSYGGYIGITYAF